MRSDEYATVAGLAEVAPAFTDMEIVHTLWTWDGTALVGWVGSILTPMKQAHLEHTPYVSCSYWDGAEAYDTCVAECRAELLLDETSRVRGWELFRSTPPPLGYDPALLPQWKDGPTSPRFGVLRLEPWHLRILPGEFARSNGATGRVLTWQQGENR